MSTIDLRVSSVERRLRELERAMLQVPSRPVAGGADGSAIVQKGVKQTSHGFAVGDVVYRTGTTWAKAKADALATAGWEAVVSQVGGANTFDLTFAGLVTGLSGLTAGAISYLSDATAGALLARSALTATGFPAPVLLAIDATSAIVLAASLIGMDLQGLRIDFGSSNTVTLKASDVVGTSRDIKLREIDVCVSGVAKKMLVLCSDFY